MESPTWLGATSKATVRRSDCNGERPDAARFPWTLIGAGPVDLRNRRRSCRGEELLDWVSRVHEVQGNFPHRSLLADHSKNQRPRFADGGHLEAVSKYPPVAGNNHPTARRDLAEPIRIGCTRRKVVVVGFDFETRLFENGREDVTAEFAGDEIGRDWSMRPPRRGRRRGSGSRPDRSRGRVRRSPRRRRHGTPALVSTRRIRPVPVGRMRSSG